MSLISEPRLEREDARREWLAAAEILACSSARLRLARFRSVAPISEGPGGCAPALPAFPPGVHAAAVFAPRLPARDEVVVTNLRQGTAIRGLRRPEDASRARHYHR
jgi:hypothetical protein